jgi:hypothetical protein
VTRAASNGVTALPRTQLARFRWHNKSATHAHCDPPPRILESRGPSSRCDTHGARGRAKALVRRLLYIATSARARAALSPRRLRRAPSAPRQSGTAPQRPCTRRRIDVWRHPSRPRRVDAPAPRRRAVTPRAGARRRATGRRRRPSSLRAHSRKRPPPFPSPSPKNPSSPPAAALRSPCIATKAARAKGRPPPLLAPGAPPPAAKRNTHTHTHTKSNHGPIRHGPAVRDAVPHRGRDDPAAAQGAHARRAQVVLWCVRGPWIPGAAAAQAQIRRGARALGNLAHAPRPHPPPILPKQSKQQPPYQKHQPTSAPSSRGAPWPRPWAASRPRSSA